MTYHFGYTPKDYLPAIKLALNYHVGGLKIINYEYFEEMDIWHIEATEQGLYHVKDFTLEGNFIRSCYKAAKEGVRLWRQPQR